jgi:hypothetical protein
MPNATADSIESFATCYIEGSEDDIIEDWLTGAALDFTSETLKYTVLQNYSQPWLSHSLENYTTGMLTVGYHAAHGGSSSPWKTQVPQSPSNPQRLWFAGASTEKSFTSGLA